MNTSTKVFLVLLRLAIGWHFLVEGIEKIQSVNVGKTETNRPWTSEPYLRESTGPFSTFFHNQAGGDPDDLLLARLQLLPLPEGQDETQVPQYKRFPSELAKDWDLHYQRFLKQFEHHFTPLTDKDLSAEQRKTKTSNEIKQLLDEENQKRNKINEEFRKRAEAKFAQAKEQTVVWLLQGKKTVTQPLAAGSTEVEKTTPHRIKDYETKLKAVREILDKKLPAFDKDVEKDKLRTLKGELARSRNELLADLKNETARMKVNLESAVLTDLDQWPARLIVLTSIPQAGLPVTLAVAGLMQHVPEAEEPKPTARIDWITRYGLTTVGLCLLLGLFTRTACVAGAIFLLLFFLAMPPLPWLPDNPKAEGHYLFINKNFIEMLALLALATTRSGRWAGLDALVQFLHPRYWRKRRDDANRIRIDSQQPTAP